MNRSLSLVLIFLVLVAMGGVPALAATPQLLNYQGYLANPADSALTTNVVMTFTLYDAPTNGNTLWTEIHPTVSVAKGLFNVLLGSVATLPTSVFTGANAYLGISVGTDPEMTPRARVAATAYAYRVGTVDGATGGTVTGDVTIVGKGNIGTGNTNSGNLSFVVGRNNSANGEESTVCGGLGNVAEAIHCTVGGGFENHASNVDATVGGGAHNQATGDRAVISGGHENLASASQATVGGGWGNIASGTTASILGGYYNLASNVDAVVVGGTSNAASGARSFVGGGETDTASGDNSTVAGGLFNTASGPGATICGGNGNLSGNNDATVSGGFHNAAMGFRAFVGGGENDSANADHSTVGGGNGNTASLDGSTVAGGQENRASGDRAAVAGGLRNAATGFRSFVGGGEYDTASAGHATIGGGDHNLASFEGSTVAGGQDNRASGDHSVIGGGLRNTASGYRSFVGGGEYDTASGYFAVVPGGQLNLAQGALSFAAGRRAKAYNNGCFVWGDQTDADVTTNGDNQFKARATGGVWFYTNTALTAGLRLAAGGSSWLTISDSTKKQNIRLVDTRDMLSKVRSLPIKQWSYKSQDPSIEHVGPMAQDFYNLFKLGDDNISISTIDPSGIALAAIQELAKKNEKLEAEVATLKAMVERMASATPPNPPAKAEGLGMLKAAVYVPKGN